MVTKTCSQCGKTFERKTYHAKISKNHFCGFACYGAWQKINRPGIGRNRTAVKCDTCGKQINKQPSAISNHNFCNRQCWAVWRSSDAFFGKNNPAWRGGSTSYRGGNWNKQRKAARDRDKDTCQSCGVIKSSLPVHHKIPFHLFDSYVEANDIDNLVTLCPACHSKADNEFWNTHQGLVKNRRFPDCAPVKKCNKCRNDFQPRSGKTMFCDECCTFTCACCGAKFYSRKISDRTPKYCSRKCRNIHIRVSRA